MVRWGVVVALVGVLAGCAIEPGSEDPTGSVSEGTTNRTAPAFGTEEALNPVTTRPPIVDRPALGPEVDPSNPLNLHHRVHLQIVPLTPDPPPDPVANYKPTTRQD